MTRRYPSRHRIEQLFRRAGIPMRLRAETNLSGTICDLVRLGHGVAILNGLSWAGGSQDALQVRPLTPHLANRSEEHTSELQSLMRISYAVFCLKKKKTTLTQYKKHKNTHKQQQ